MVVWLAIRGVPHRMDVIAPSGIVVESRRCELAGSRGRTVAALACNRPDIFARDRRRTLAWPRVGRKRGRESLFPFVAGVAGRAGAMVHACVAMLDARRSRSTSTPAATARSTPTTWTRTTGTASSFTAPAAGTWRNRSAVRCPGSAHPPRSPVRGGASRSRPAGPRSRSGSTRAAATCHQRT